MARPSTRLLLVCLVSVLAVKVNGQSVMDSNMTANNVTFTNVILSLTNATSTSNTTISTSYECSASQADTCELEFNRSCYEGSCSSCLPDFVALPEEVLDLTEEDNITTIVSTLRATGNGTVCVPLQTLKVALFERVFQPLWTDVLTSEQRLSILLRVAQHVAQHNLQVPRPNYTLALNEYSAAVGQEIQQLGGYVTPSDGELVLAFLIEQELQELETSSDAELPTSIDWVERGAVTSVKTQGACGCCWSISIAGAIEGAAAIWSNYTYLQSISFQQLISCDKSNNGCNGGFPASALAYANTNLQGGTVTLNQYPFTDGITGETTTTCLVDQYPIAVTSQLGRAVTFYGNVDDDTYDIRMQKMKSGVARQPIAVAVNSNCDLFRNYKSGIVTDDGDCSCLPTTVEGCLDHAVLMVGYNDDDDIPYWKIKNSWGTRWGEDGYIRIAQFNPHQATNSWGLFGVLAEGVAPLQAFNATEQVYDEPQGLLAETWEKVLVMVGIFAVVAIIVMCACMVKNKMCGRKSDPDT